MVIEFGTLLRSLRMSRGFSQDELSARLGVSQRHLSFIETGKARPARDLVMNAASTLELLYVDKARLLKLAGFAAGLPRACSVHDVPLTLFKSAERLLVIDPVIPSFLLDDRLRLVRMNSAFAARLAPYDDFSEFMDGSYISFPLLMLHPKGLATRNAMTATHEAIVAFVQWILRERLKNPEKLGPIVDRLLRFPICADGNNRIEPGGVVEGVLLQVDTPLGTCRERTRLLEIDPPHGFAGDTVPRLYNWAIMPEDEETRGIYKILAQAATQHLNDRLRPYLVHSDQHVLHVAAE